MDNRRFSPRADMDVRVGDILSQSVGLWSKVVAPYFLLFGLATLPSVIQQYELKAHAVRAPGPFFEWLGGAALVALIIGTLARGGVVSMCLDILAGRNGNFGVSLGVGAQSFPRLLGAQICAGFALIFAFLLIFVPGFMLISAWLVITPACVGERLGPIASLQRSAALTKGYRWKMFGLLLVLVVVGIGVALAGAVTSRMVGATAASLVQLIVTALAGPFNEVVAVVTYAALRSAKEGASTARLADVF